jgi:hypothetical protein
MENPPEPLPAPPCTPAQERLLRIARQLWSIPLRLGTLILLFFLLTDSLRLAGLGVIALEAGGLCAIAGIIATLVVATQRRRSHISGDDPCQHAAFQTLGLLLSNFAVAGLYAYIGIAQIGTSISTQARSPSGIYIAEVSHLDEADTPPYGQAVLMRPARNPFKFLLRTTVFRGYCENIPVLTWTGDRALEIDCTHPAQVAVQKTAYRDVVVSYRTKNPLPGKSGRKGKL